ncbi:type II toxin-antitoxin system VapC family toxin [Candidatus Bathyarchaeota archaeon]|nr:type II toxin-antitoxin system VapC family toxin [Candidatus Bathyarchaeota archaeon]
MTEKLVYLDSSAIVKRYLEEKGSRGVDYLYRQAELGNLVLGYSVWNVGEVIGVLDRYAARGLLDEGRLVDVLGLYYGENLKLVKLGALRVEPMGHGVLREAWRLLLKHHIYVADALQLSTAKRLEAACLVSADGLLIEKAEPEGLQAVNVEEGLEAIKEKVGLSPESE